MVEMKKMNQFFHIIAKKSAQAVGNAWSFIVALSIIIIWIVSGPFFHFSDTWQLIINTATTIVTFLIVFLIQNTQNRDTEMIQLKLNELIRAHHLAHNSIIDLEKLSDSQMKELEAKYNELANNE
jgi:low affinity Fe/Cu permease